MIKRTTMEQKNLEDRISEPDAHLLILKEEQIAELEAQVAQLREVLEEYHNRNYTHNDSEHELWLKSKAALSATPAQASPEQSRRTAYLAALEFINKIINMPMGPLNIADVEALRIIAKAAKRGER